MVIYLLNKTRLTFYSVVDEDKKSNEKSINGMIRRLLTTKYRGKYNTALIFDNATGTMIQKYVRGVREL